MLLSGPHTWRRLIRSRIFRSTAHSRRKALRQQPGRFDVAAMVEQLEDRVLLSVSTPVLGSGTDVVFNGDGDIDSIY